MVYGIYIYIYKLNCNHVICTLPITGRWLTGKDMAVSGNTATSSSSRQACSLASPHSLTDRRCVALVILIISLDNTANAYLHLLILQ